MTRILKNYAYCGDRRVHYITAGNGPPLVMFHQSPRSASEYVPLIEEWAKYFTIIAPDTPGYGQSDPLEITEPDMTDIAHAQMTFLKTIGITQFAAYGYHTGSTIALAIAGLYPKAVNRFVMNGFSVLSKEEKESFLKEYLPAFQPDWSGSHLAWLWSRYREQLIFFPWYAKNNASRMPYDIAPLDILHQQVLDHLYAGDAYRSAYGAAFAFDKKSFQSKVTAPSLIMAAPPDPLTAHLDRLSDMPENFELVRPENRDDAHAVALEYLRKTDLPKLKNFHINSNTKKPNTAKTWREYFGQHNNLHCLVTNYGKARVLVIHDILQSSNSLKSLIGTLADAEYEVIAPDLPGHGLTNILSDTFIEELTNNLNAADKLPDYILTIGQSAAMGPQLKKAFKTAKLINFDFFKPASEKSEAFTQNYMPDMTAQKYGGHLLTGWSFLRMKNLFWPWYEEKKENIIAAHPDSQPHVLQTDFVALMQTTKVGLQLAHQLLQSAVTDKHEVDISVCPDWVKTRNDIALGSDNVAFYDSETNGHTALVELLNSLSDK